VTADPKSRVYGAPDPAFTATITGFVLGQTLATSGVTGNPALTSPATTASAPGPYTITPTLGTLVSANYSFTFVNGVLTIGQAATTTTITNLLALSVQTLVGQSYVVNWTVSPAPPGTGIPLGQVVVKDGDGAGSTFCTALVAAGSCTLTSTTPGNKTITVTYGGDTNFTGSSATTSHLVVIGVTGNIKQFVPGGPNTDLAGVTVSLTGSSTSTATTDASGNYAFTLVTGGSYVITPGGLGKTYEAISRTYNNVTANITGADFVAYNTTGTGGIPRFIRVVDTATTAGQTVAVPITVTSQGTETRLAMSLNYDPAVLGVPTGVVCGSGAVGCTINSFNTATPGKVGITLTPATALTAGARQIAVITFPTFATNLANTPITFGDVPTVRDVRNAEGNPIPAFYLAGVVAFTQPTGIEGDTVDQNGGPAGDNVVLSNDVAITRQIALGNVAPPATGAKFKKTTNGPMNTATNTYGDGTLNTCDVTVTRQYSLGNFNPTAAAGPLGPLAAGADEGRRTIPEIGRTIRAVNAIATADRMVTLPVEIDSLGNESAMSFTMSFDPAVMTYVSSDIGTGVPAQANLATNVNQIATGKLGVLIDAAETYTIGTRQIMTVTFAIAANAPSGTYPVTFTGAPTQQSVSDMRGFALQTTFEAGTVTPAELTGFTVSGSVRTPAGLGLRNAVVTLIDTTTGTRKIAVTGSFGLFTFTRVPTGSYTISVQSKRFRFAPQPVNVNNNLANVDMVGLE